MKTHRTLLIEPGDSRNVKYWTRKLGVDSGQLFDAIINTGSVHSQDVKKYLRRNSWFYHPVNATSQLVRSLVAMVF